MALPPTEIRYGKSVKYFLLGMFVFFMIMMIFTFFVSGATAAGPMTYTVGFAFTPVLVFIFWHLYKRFTSPDPVLVFTSDGLQVPAKGNRFIPWGAISEWKIRRNKNNYSLVIRTPQGKTRIDISWLDLPAKEIQRLMETYIRQPGPRSTLS